MVNRSTPFTQARLRPMLMTRSASLIARPPSAVGK
jgi:hypothetical protein